MPKQSIAGCALRCPALSANLGVYGQGLQNYASVHEHQLPPSTSEEWALRVPEEEKWRQMGVDGCEKLLRKTVASLPGGNRGFLVVTLNALPTDWMQAVTLLQKARRALLARCQHSLPALAV